MDRAASLKPGSGKLELLGYATLERAGAALDLEAKLRPNLSTFAQAWAGAARVDRWKPDAGVMAGLRWTW